MASERDLIKQIESQIARFTQAFVAAQFWHGRYVEEAEQKYKERLAEDQSKHQRALGQAEESYQAASKEVQRRLSANESAHQQASSKVFSIYKMIVEETLGSSQEIAEQASPAIAPWDSAFWAQWTPPSDSEALQGLQLGTLSDEGSWDTLTLLALLPFIGERAFLIKAGGQGSAQAVRTIQSLLLRLLASIPPGKLRFVFLDPVGLGQNVAAFMHLSDHDEALVTGKAWTEPQHIEQR
nr:hypothetical protein [Ardenticatenales bacterium]